MNNKYDFYINFYKINVDEKIHTLIHQNNEIQKNIFFDGELKKYMQLYVQKTIHKRLILFKCILKWLNIIHSKRRIVNDTNLYLSTSFKNPIIIVQDKKKYCFEAMELIKIYKNSLESVQNWMIKPMSPTNPYTNQAFNLIHHCYIYNAILQYKLSIPTTMALYKYYSYNIKKLWKNQKYYFIDLFAKNTINELDIQDRVDFILFICDKFMIGKYHESDIRDNHIHFSKIMNMYIFFMNQHLIRYRMTFDTFRLNLLDIIKTYKIPLLRKSTYYKK